MRTETIHILTLIEAETLLASWFERDEYGNLVADMEEGNTPGWGNDTTPSTIAEPPAARITNPHTEHLSEVKAQGRVMGNWELSAVFSDMADRERIPYGLYLIEVCW